MKITFITPVPGIGGGIRVIAIYADKLKKRGHDVLLISSKPRPVSLKNKLKSFIKGQGWPNPKKRESHYDHIDVPYKSVDHYGPITDNDVPDGDIIIATWFTTANCVNALSRSKGAKAYFIQGYDACVSEPLAEAVETTWNYDIHKITISQWLKDFISEKSHDNDISLVPNSVDLDQFNAPLRNKGKDVVVGFLNVLPDISKRGIKGSDISLKAFKIARTKCPKLRLIIFGHKLDKKIKQHFPEDTLFNENPPQGQIKFIYSSCDAWLFPSRIEGFGLPILEAMACRTPVIGTPAGAAPELISKYGGGILVNHEDPEDMAKAILRVCDMPNEEWRAMSDAAYKTATEYTWDDATDLFEAALYRAVEKAKGNNKI